MLCAESPPLEKRDLGGFKKAENPSKSESDWDLLVLLDGPVNDERVDRVRHRLYEVEWEFDEVISSIVRNRDQ